MISTAELHAAHQGIRMYKSSGKIDPHRDDKVSDLSSPGQVTHFGVTVYQALGHVAVAD